MKNLALSGVLLCLSLIFSTSWAQDTTSLPPDTLQADPEQTVIVENIEIKGNKRTKPYIILRELDFEKGDTLPVRSLPRQFDHNEQQIVNTGLFYKVDMTVKDWASHYITIHIKVYERWYTFPVPIFELADRNFNVWWVEYSHDLSRTKYGVKFYQENIRGRNEELSVVAQLGFSQHFELGYTIPYIDQQLEKGLSLNFTYTRNKEIPYITREDKLLYFRHSEYLRRKFQSEISLTQRKGLNTKHTFNLKYHDTKINDTIRAMNEFYFQQNRLNQQFLQFIYRFRYNLRDDDKYPLKGSLTKLKFRKSGLGIFPDLNKYLLRLEYARYLPLSSRFYSTMSVRGQFSYPRQQPYHNQQALGYGTNFVRGYEYYVVDGQHYALAKSSLKYQLLDWEFTKTQHIPLQQFKAFPIEIYFKIFADVGYVQDRFFYLYNRSRLANSLLMGGGVGVDFVSFYDLVWRVEYSYNRLHEHGLFLHFKAAM